MPGFCGKIGEVNFSKQFNEIINENLIVDFTASSEYYIERRTVNKFLNDKVFEENDSYLVLIEGVILNSLELKNKYASKSFYKTIIEMYKLNGAEFFNEFRGSFSGVFFDKSNDLKIIFTDQIGDKQIFYSEINNELTFGSEINYIIENFTKSNISYTLNTTSAYNLLTFGFLIEDGTLVNEIHKLIAGHYILLKNGKIEIKCYYKLDNTPDENQSESEIIDSIDKLFRNAVKKSFDKDKEYGYKHLVGLSSGLDSRMTTWVANDLGYSDNIVNFTFSQSNYLDETIPKKISEHLKHEWIFKSLDNGLFLKNLEDTVKISSGGALYYGMAHSKSCFDLLNMENFGIIHTGQLGDVVISTFYSSTDTNKQFSLNQGAYSKLLKHKIQDQKLKLEYKNEEIFKFYSRGFNGANQGLLIAQEYTETFSPFYDLDFMEYCLKIPLKFRFKHNIYIKWILKKYPEAAKFIWGKINNTITDNAFLLTLRKLKKQLIFKPVKSILKRLGKRRTGTFSRFHMNPLDYWYANNPDIKNFMDDYFENHIDQFDFNNKLKTDLMIMYKKGKCVEKTQALTLLAFYKLYFKETEWLN